MKVKIDHDKCIGCGSCVGLNPDIFHFNDEGLADAKEEEIPENVVEATEDAKNSCPVGAIEEEE